ncbi:MAG: ribonuclease [Lachnospiraceae bacterium]|nr:ribonuclease [Lachnospiraceae bacterium]
MKRKWFRLRTLLCALLCIVCVLTGCAGEYVAEYVPEYSEAEVWQEEAYTENHDNQYIDREGTYTTAEDVALYLYTYDELPDNFMTKDEARELGWSGGSLEDYAPGMCIGGDYFGNYEGLLPEEPGRDYYECDINTLGADSRGAKRIVYSDDGLIYYTDDHYESFTLLYGDE